MGSQRETGWGQGSGFYKTSLARTKLHPIRNSLILYKGMLSTDPRFPPALPHHSCFKFSIVTHCYHLEIKFPAQEPLVQPTSPKFWHTGMIKFKTRNFTLKRLCLHLEFRVHFSFIKMKFFMGGKISPIYFPRSSCHVGISVQLTSFVRKGKRN